MKLKLEISWRHKKMGMTIYNETFKKAKSWVLEAGENLRIKMDEPMSVDTKSDPNDLVTSLDRETEKFFVTQIKTNFPEHKLFGEEGYGDEISSLDGFVWIVDPIDGTMNFVHQKQNFCISLALYKNGVGQFGIIYNVIDDHLYVGKRNRGAFKNNKQLPPLKDNLQLEQSILGMNHFWLCKNKLVDYRQSQNIVRTVRGTRTYGSAALEFAYVAEGILDGYLALQLSPWDVAAGLIIVQEVGGITTNIAGESLDLLNRSSVLTCHPKIHAKIVDNFKKHS